MSRIHEALKKAAEERTAQLSSGPPPDLVDVAADVSRTTVPREHRGIPSLVDLPPKRDSSILSFEELMQKCLRLRWQPDPRSNVFDGAHSDQVGAESFRTLRSRLYQIAGTRQLKRILVTSSVPQEGKTLVAANLAQSLARQDRSRVLLIDADLRASRMHHVLGAPAAPGLVDYLRDQADECTVIQRGDEENLCFIPGGSPVSNPSELLLSARVKQLVERVTPVFDWVVLDSPPALPVHDASLLADLCDGVLFVVRAGATDFEVVEKASSEFRDKNLLGVVLNRTEKSDSYGGYYYGYSAAAKKKS
jgi:protein-tyrosine kinase